MNLTGKPLVHRLLKSFGSRHLHLADHASDTWQIAPPETAIENPTYALPGQFERVQKISMFSTSMASERSSLQGGQKVVHSATTAYLLRNVVLVDGGLYKGLAAQHLHRRTRHQWFAKVAERSARHALFCTFGGNTYFGTWLMDDCVSYPLAKACGIATRTPWPVLSRHMQEYSNILQMESEQLDNILFKELVVFNDLGQNQSKKKRAKSMAEKLVAQLEVKPHPGVFMVRGASGTNRALENEQEIALHLNRKFGLRVVDPTQLSVNEISAACAGAQLVVGVEGSHLLHGILHLAVGGSLLALQPPTRYCTLLKGLTERDGQKFGMVVGTPGLHIDSFTIDVDEVDRTIALMLDAP